MHNPERAKYPSLTLVEVLQNLLKTKQGDKEELLEYLSWFKSKRDIIYCLLRKGFLDYYAKNTQEYTNPMSDDIRTNIKTHKLERFIVIFFLENTNYDKYNNFLLDYHNLFTNNDNKYPGILQAMIDAMR